MTLRKTNSNSFTAMILPGFGFVCVALALSGLITLLAVVFRDGWSSLSWEFLQQFPSRIPSRAGILSALVGSLWIILLTALIAIPLGVGTGMFLMEYLRESRCRRWIEMNIRNLSGVPSVVFGILGLAVFVRFFGFDRSILSGAMTMSLLILPILVLSTVEALKAVPDSLRMAAYGLGATKLQMIWSHLLPAALPGILTGILLAISRALGESAPLIMIGALSFVAFVPSSIHDSFTVLSIQIFNWAGRPQPEFQNIAAAAIIVLLAVTLTLNGVAIWLRARLMKN